MKNHKPLQFIKECPDYVDLWNIIDETIINPKEGLSVETLKYYLYLFIRSGNFKETKKVLQTNMETEDVLFVKNHIRSISAERTIKYVELLPEVEGLPKQLIIFLCCNHYSSDILPLETVTDITKVLKVLNKPMPKLTTLRHTDSIVEVSSKYELELRINEMLIEGTAIPNFKLVRDTEFYPRYFKSKLDGAIVEFTDLTIGKIVSIGESRKAEPLGHVSKDWIEHTNTNTWEEVPKPEEVPF